MEEEGGGEKGENGLANCKLKKFMISNETDYSPLSLNCNPYFFAN